VSIAPGAGVAAPAGTARAFPAYVAHPGEPARSEADRRFDALVDAWFAAEASERPTWATNVGIHDHDAKLEATSRAAILGRLARVRKVLDEAGRLEPGQLGPWRRIDQAAFVSRLRAIELELATIRSWERNPNWYPNVLSSGIFSLVKREYAPADVRMKAATARLAEAPRVFADARANLARPPRIQTEVAIAQTRGLIAFLEGTVPERLATAKDAPAREEFERRRREAIAEVRAYVTWLERDLLPRSDGDFRIGRQAYQDKLLHDEGFAEPVDSVLARGYRELAENHRRMVETARQIDPAKTPQEVLAAMAAEHPAEDRLLDATRSGLDKIRRFIEEKRICTPPPNQNLIVAETPIFNRSSSFASMDSPGVYEQNANEAYYNVTPVDSAWSAEKKAEHLGFYNPWQLEIVSIHEAFPGHYYQFLHLKKVPSLVRQLMGTGSNSEGWAHYCEEMAIEQGFGGDDPRYTMAMLNLALQRIGRYIAGIEMHVNGWTMDQATDFFATECYMARVNAEREARRGTSDPTYLVYSLGKWEFQRLRADVQRAQGDRFDLGSFHDRILELGRLPLPLMRTALLDDTGTGLQTASP
jgi:uncharacterized protein (DUF885 family)